MRAIYLALDGSLRVDDAHSDLDGRPRYRVSFARLPKMKLLAREDAAAVTSPYLDVDHDEYIVVAQTRHFVVYEQVR